MHYTLTGQTLYPIKSLTESGHCHRNVYVRVEKAVELVAVRGEAVELEAEAAGGAEKKVFVLVAGSQPPRPPCNTSHIRHTHTQQASTIQNNIQGTLTSSLCLSPCSHLLLIAV